MPGMKRVESSHIWEIGHEGDTLSVRFWPSVKHPAGRVVSYQGVDAKTAAAVMTAPSIGSALHSMIKGKYEVAE
jgi:hypothetical protein